MADIMRATKNVPGFHDSAKVHLLEISPALRAMQAAALENYAPEWHVNLETLPDRPMIVVANEFLDALPVRQLIHTADGWKERVVGIVNGNFAFDTKELPFNLPVDAAEGAIFEISPVRSQFVTDLVKKLNGAALIIDYGHSESGIGDTLQALKSHKYISPLEEIGNADLTTHVDFHAVKLAAEAAGAEVSGPVEQGAFLKDLGIGQRAEILTLRATPAQKFDIEKALQRLVDPSQMGSLFKVMGLTNGQNLSLPGF